MDYLPKLQRDFFLRSTHTTKNEKETLTHSHTHTTKCVRTKPKLYFHHENFSSFFSILMRIVVIVVAKTQLSGLMWTTFFFLLHILMHETNRCHWTEPWVAIETINKFYAVVSHESFSNKSKNYIAWNLNCMVSLKCVLCVCFFPPFFCFFVFQWTCFHLEMIHFRIKFQTTNNFVSFSIFDFDFDIDRLRVW